MKKAQITVFIVLGVVVMVIAGMVFFINSRTSEAGLENRVNKIYTDFLGSTGIKGYVTNCLERSTKEAVRLAALQGGKIYDYQAGGGYSLPSVNQHEKIMPFEVDGVVYNVSYGIRAPNRLLSIYPKYNYYPYPGMLVNNPQAQKAPKNAYSSVFALLENDIHNRYSLTSLCNYYGPNTYDLSPDAAYTCETTTLTNISFQQYLSAFIFNMTKECVNFPQFRSQTKYNISDENIKGFVLIGNDDIFVNIRYPITISIKNYPPVTKFLEFTYRPKIRLKKMHELAVHLIGYRPVGEKVRAEADNIFFNITKNDSNDCFGDDDIGSQPCILKGMNVTKVRDYCLGNALCDEQLPGMPEHYMYTDIINITDRNSSIDGRPLTLLFAVENRDPALNNTNPDLSDPSFDPSMGKIVVKKDDTITFFALDPDEDNVVCKLGDDEDYSPDDISLGDFTDNGECGFKANKIGTYRGIINVSDDEGLYDYQYLEITVNSP